MQKKLDWLKISPLVENLECLCNQADIQAILPTHELVISTKFHKDWSKNVDFLVAMKFCASLFFLHQSLIQKCRNRNKLGGTNTHILTLQEFFGADMVAIQCI